MPATIKIGYQKDEALAPNFAEDTAWINEHRLDLYEEFGSALILVFHKEVIGHGKDLETALLEAQKHFSDTEMLVTPVIKQLSNPFGLGFFRVRMQENE